MQLNLEIFLDNKYKINLEEAWLIRLSCLKKGIWIDKLNFNWELCKIDNQYLLNIIKWIYRKHNNNKNALKCAEYLQNTLNQRGMI